MNVHTNEVVLQARGLSRSYGNIEVLAPLNLDIAVGRVYGLLGANGAGKTTLLSILAAHIKPTRGWMSIDGLRVNNAPDARKVQNKVSYLHQNPSYIPHFSARDMVEYAAWLKGVSRQERRVRAREALEQVSLGEHANKKMKALSGGMKQRVMLACALVNQPKILLLDEPTVGLDPLQRIEFRKLLETLDQTAIVLSTHIIDDLSLIADEIVILDQGMMKYQGSMRELTSQSGESTDGLTQLERAYAAIIQ